MTSTTEARDHVSFVSRQAQRPHPIAQDTVDYWSPQVTGDWSTDCATGRRYADEMLARIRKNENPTALGHIVKAMVGHGQWGGVEVGFFQRLSEDLLRTQD